MTVSREESSPLFVKFGFSIRAISNLTILTWIAVPPRDTNDERLTIVFALSEVRSESVALNHKFSFFCLLTGGHDT